MNDRNGFNFASGYHYAVPRMYEIIHDEINNEASMI